MAKSSARGRSLTPPQVVSMLVVFLTLSCVGGVLSAGFAAPFVGATAALTKASAELFEELPSEGADTRINRRDDAAPAAGRYRPQARRRARWPRRATRQDRGRLR